MARPGPPVRVPAGLTARFLRAVAALPEVCKLARCRLPHVHRKVVREPSGASADATMVTLHRGEPVTTRPVLRFVEACFDELGKHQVAEDHRDEDEKELDRQRSEAEHVLERRERQDCSDGGTRDRQGDHRPARSETPRPGARWYP